MTLYNKVSFSKAKTIFFGQLRIEVRKSENTELADAVHLGTRWQRWVEWMAQVDEWSERHASFWGKSTRRPFTCSRYMKGFRKNLTEARIRERASRHFWSHQQLHYLIHWKGISGTRVVTSVKLQHAAVRLNVLFQLREFRFWRDSYNQQRDLKFKLKRVIKILKSSACGRKMQHWLSYLKDVRSRRWNMNMGMNFILKKERIAMSVPWKEWRSQTAIVRGKEEVVRQEKRQERMQDKRNARLEKAKMLRKNARTKKSLAT